MHYTRVAPKVLYRSMYLTFQGVKNKGADQTEHITMLVCAFVVPCNKTFISDMRLTLCSESIILNKTTFHN